eukprot:CAMPEP_0113605058 /NCGR_PEP_ID=MMETSP0017_2-20120614/2123_1 /TAXON_ID=2856 /ORGANISM="Cylindrotheca closterium" /LENGTH=402 /DNA_ID=CAMNT_0000513519 /DNA_START=431 /DNA_END=1638 /DNA_ORIENTATION=+ /assembly_acc=CAM_ASM_000147
MVLAIMLDVGWVWRVTLKLGTAAVWVCIPATISDCHNLQELGMAPVIVKIAVGALEDQLEVYIPDNSCNELETGSNGDQCCKDASTTGSLDTTTAPAFGDAIKDYTLPAPDCSITADRNVKCDFTGIAPATGTLALSITGYTDCTGAAARSTDISLPTGAATANAAGGLHSVTIDLTTATLDLTAASSEEFKFCLLTSLKDGTGNEVIYQGQKITATFTVDLDFEVTGGIASEEYNGFEEKAVDKTYGVTAFQCDINRNEITTSPALAIGTTLFICLDSTDANTVIASVATLEASKTGLTSNVLNGNTEKQGEGTGAVTIGTRPYVEFFKDATPLQISGTVTLADSGGRRHLARILQSELSEEFELQVELEAVEEIDESSANSSTAATAAVALLGAIIVAIM